MCDREQQKEKIKSSVKNSVNNIIKKEGYLTHEVEYNDYSTDGGNYMGFLNQVTIKGVTEDGEKEKHFFLKVSLPDDNKSIIGTRDAYLREITFYKEMVQHVRVLQDDIKMPEGERLKTINCDEETNVNVIFLENMVMRGYDTMYRMDVVTIKFAEMAVEQMARLHGASFVLEKLRPDFFKSSVKTITTPLQVHDEEKFDSFTTNIYNYVKQCFVEEDLEKIKIHLKNSCKSMHYYLSPNPSLTNVLCHGDYRSNNMLTKEVNGEIIDLVPIDYQLIHYGAAVNDFIYFIYSSTDREFRKRHLEYLKTVYHTSMGKYLRRFNIDVDKVFPRKAFDADFKKNHQYAVLVILYLCPFLFCPEEEVTDLGNNTLLSFGTGFDARMKGRLQGTFDEFKDLNIF